MNIVDQARAIIAAAIRDVKTGDEQWLEQIAADVEAARSAEIPSWLVLDAVIAALESQAAQIEKLRAAVEPFAKAADLYNDCEQHPNGCPDDAQAGELFGVFVGDFRRARQAYEDTK